MLVVVDQKLCIVLDRQTYWNTAYSSSIGMIVVATFIRSTCGILVGIIMRRMGI